MTFGERLTALRKEHGYATRNEFADFLGIPSTTLRNYETNAREPGHTFLKQISELFNVSADYLLCLTDEKELLNSMKLKEHEEKIVRQYRQLDKHGQKIINFILEEEHERSIEISASENTKGHEMTLEEIMALHAELPEDPKEFERLYSPVKSRSKK